MAYPSNNADSVAQDQLKAFVRRIESVEDEINALNSDKSEIYKEARGNGFDTKQLRKVVAKRKLGADERSEQDAIFDLYWDAVHGLAHAHVENIEQFGTDEAKPESNLQKVQTAPTEPQPPVSAGSDLAASPANDDGQVADHSDIDIPISNEVPAQDSGGNETSSNDDSKPLGKSNAARPASVDANVNDGSPAGETGVEVVTGGESAATKSIYAPKGETVWELTPPEGVIRHEYSQAFGEAGQDIAVIEEDMAKAASAPIVKIGNVILDGWARYLKARELGIEYPVEQYAGTDSLMDCIKWNTGGRMMTSEQSFRIAQRLAKAEPKRKAEIYAAFELGMELA